MRSGRGKAISRLRVFSRHVVTLREVNGRLRADLPAGLAGCWCLVRLHGVSAPVRLSFVDQERGQVVRDVFLIRGRHGVQRVLVHVPLHARLIEFLAFTEPDHAIECVVKAVISRLPRAVAGAWLALRALPSLLQVLPGSGLSRPGLLRALIGRASLQLAAAPDYATWTRLYDPATPAVPQLGNELLVAVVEDAGAAVLLDRSLASLRRAGLSPAAVCRVADPQAWRAALARAAGRPVAVLQAGECVASGGLAAMLAGMRNGAALAYGDDDRLDLAGARTRPHFKPLIAPALLHSFTLSSGLMAFRPSLLEGITDAALVHADSIRLAATLQAFAAEPAPVLHRLQRVLTHRLDGTADPPWQVAQDLVRADLARRGCSAEMSVSSVGLTVRRTSSATRSVGIVVPSACRSRHVLFCIRRLIERTEFPIDSVVVAISSPSPDARQRRIMAALGRLPRVRVLNYPLAEFDFAAINNLAAQEIRSELLLLLNDDVAPLGRDWLGRMVAQLDDSSVGVVGARLLYGNGMAQHAGVVVGLAHLCEHNDRFLREGDPGPFGSVVLDRDVSAVTGACLLIRTELWRRLGGLDPAFAIALNDVDLCLRARAAGSRVVYAAGAVLTHYESLSLGRHYAGQRAGREGSEVRLLRQRWSAVIADDPFYNRNMSQEIGREWQPSFPPRQPADGKVE